MRDWRHIIDNRYLDTAGINSSHSRLASAARSFQMGQFRGSFDFIAGISDGLERLALDMGACIPHPPFFSPLARRLKSEMDREAFQSGLRQLLESERVCSRTDDDKSLVLMVKNE